ncbi:MAG: hypothetical protein K6F75_08165 [Butyrivibrio sp.]|nr:hypothetical protein [Butyrivibrio sp.]
MIYKYGAADNYEDFASGRVIYGGKGIPNFPVRLITEIFGRALEYSKKKENLTIYDPCCGGAYSLTVLGYFYGKQIGKIYGSDISEEMISHACKNLNLLSYAGLDERKTELEKLYSEFGKDSHKEAIESIDKLKERLVKDIEAECFTANCTKSLPDIKPDIIITDIPYGNLVDWGGEGELDAMMENLLKLTGDDTVLAVSMDKGQKIACEGWHRVIKQNIGKRRFEILCKKQL